MATGRFGFGWAWLVGKVVRSLILSVIKEEKYHWRNEKKSRR
ncbi:hypothetical protein ABE073_01675 [Lederbergia citrisecunda]